MTQTQTNQQTIFVNLYAAIIAEKQKQLDNFTKDLLHEKDIKAVLSNWQYSDLLPAGKKKAQWEVKTLIPYLIERKHKQVEKAIAKELAHLKAVEAAPDLKDITVSVEWKKSRTWGSNPTAEAKVSAENDFNRYNSGSIGGCGYDKESTAIANAINQSNSFLKALYSLKEIAPEIKNHDLFGYGSGYGILPRLDGGVGQSCYRSIFEKIGFEWTCQASGKTFDVYTATPLK